MDRYVRNSTSWFLVATIPGTHKWYKRSKNGLREVKWYLRLLYAPDGEQKPPRCVCGWRPGLGYSPGTAAFVFISFFKPNQMLDIFDFLTKRK